MSVKETENYQRYEQALITSTNAINSRSSIPQLEHYLTPGELAQYDQERKHAYLILVQSKIRALQEELWFLRQQQQEMFAANERKKLIQSITKHAIPHIQQQIEELENELD